MKSKDELRRWDGDLYLFGRPTRLEKEKVCFICGEMMNPGTRIRFGEVLDANGQQIVGEMRDPVHARCFDEKTEAVTPSPEISADTSAELTSPHHYSIRTAGKLHTIRDDTIDLPVAVYPDRRKAEGACDYLNGIGRL